MGSHAAGAQHVGSQQEEPQLWPQPKLHFGWRILGHLNFGHLNLGRCSFGILKHECPHPHPPQLSPQLLQQSTGAQHVGAHELPQAAGAQQVGSQALPQAAGAQQLASTGAQQVGSTLQPQPWLCLNMPNMPACALLAIENTTRAAVNVNAFISISPTHRSC